jgi:cyclophilin family peptidyl-prolyl cis-trans isomerase
MKHTTTILAAAGLLWLAGCSDDTGQSTRDGGGAADQAPGQDHSSSQDAAAPDTGGAPPKVLLKTSMGDITLELDGTRAPISVKNFLAYVDAKAYDGTIFHRVIPTFMIQGGGYDTAFTKKPTSAAIKNEADNGLSNLRGTVAMARTSVVDSATNQFFINVVDNLFLDHKDKTASGYGYAVFGEVVAGIDVVDKIKAVPTGPKGPFSSDCPQTDVVIQSAVRTK